MAITSNTIMWIIVIIMIAGLIMTFRNLNDKKCINKYEGLILTIVGLILSCSVCVLSN